MSKLFALTWRFLLAAALVSNPVAAGIAMAGEALPPVKSQGDAAAVEMPGCHDMAMAAEAAEKPTDTGKHRGHPSCQFGACCLVLTLHVSTLRMPGAEHLGVPPVSALPEGAKAPPAARMIRPPIA
jgi:hypothetical protein